MKTNIDIIREALTYYHAHSLSMDEHITANALAALSTIDTDAVPIIHGRAELETHDDAIRRGCADRAVFYVNTKYSYDQRFCHASWSIDYGDLRAAILGTEPAREECRTCGRKCPNDCPQDKTP